jgi:3-oxoisoapionate kinase
MTTQLRYGWYGDDFTGATDTLAVLAQAGLRTMLFLGVPSKENLLAAGPLDAIGVAGAARAMAPDDMRIELEKAGRFFKLLEIPVFHYKVCSTFDSSEKIGNIACAIQTLRSYVANRWVPIVGGQPSLGRYCAFSNLFAAAVTGGEVHRLDRHPTMKKHPVTPMGESDLRQHLKNLGLQKCSAIHYPAYDDLEELETSLQKLLSLASDTSTVPFLLDLTHSKQLSTLGRLIWQQAQDQHLLAVGSSAVAQALVAFWAEKNPVDVIQAMPSSVKDSSQMGYLGGPVFALAGSLSPLTARQISAANAYERIPIDALRLKADLAYKEELLGIITRHLLADRHVLAYTSVSASSNGYIEPTSHVAKTSAHLVSEVVNLLNKYGKPLSRISIAGGDTSSYVTQSLGLWGLSYLGILCPGVTVCRAYSSDLNRSGVQLILKGGQMGGDDFFQQIIDWSY